jgi:hypothetical protein
LPVVLTFLTAYMEISVAPCFLPRNFFQSNWELLERETVLQIWISLPLYLTSKASAREPQVLPCRC